MSILKANSVFDLLFSRRYEQFCAVFEYGNMRVAAEVLGVTQPALSKSLKLLESELRSPLFTRTKSGVHPTAAAEVLYRYAQSMNGLARAADLEISRLRGWDHGVIRLGAGQIWSWLFVPEIASKFGVKYPNIDLEVMTASVPELMDRLTKNELDVAVGDLKGANIPSEFKTEPVWKSNVNAFVVKGHELLQEEDVSLTHLANYAWSGYVDRDVFEGNVLSLCAENGLEPPKISVRTTSLATLLRYSQMSGSVAILPEELAAEAAKWELRPIQSKNLSLWAIETGSIIRADRAENGPYRALVGLIRSVSNGSFLNYR